MTDKAGATSNDWVCIDQTLNTYKKSRYLVERNRYSVVYTSQRSSRRYKRETNAQQIFNKVFEYAKKYNIRGLMSYMKTCQCLSGGGRVS